MFRHRGEYKGTKMNVGKLKSFGIKNNWQIPLLQPRKFLDFQNHLTDINALTIDADFDEMVLAKITDQWSLSQSGPKRLNFTFQDASGNFCNTSLFHPEPRDIAIVKSQAVVMLSMTVKRKFNNLYFNVKKIYEYDVKDRVIPVYPGKPSVISQEKVEQKIQESIEKGLHLEAANQLLSLIQRDDRFPTEESVMHYIGAPRWRLHELIAKVHIPNSHSETEFLQQKLKLVAALTTLTEGAALKKELASEESQIPFFDYVLKNLAKKMPFQLTEEQYQATNEILEGVARPQKLRHLLQGDVGSGKTVTFGICAAYISVLGYDSVIMVPNEVLAIQIHENLSKIWPEINFVLSTQASPIPKKHDYGLPTVFVGTSALITQVKQKNHVGLVVVDEMHRFSLAQRTKISDLNVLEATATPIPRTQALIQYAGFETSKISATHVNKRIVSEVIYRENKRRLKDEVTRRINDGEKILIVYSLATQEGEGSGALSVEDAYRMWNKEFPGKVAISHGKLSPEEKQKAVEEIKNGDKQLLIATTVIEVGVDIPDFKYCIVANSERFGAVQLHQIRGRLVRAGGEGLFHMYVGKNLEETDEKVQERMNILRDETDGFVIAEKDMKLRGFGDLSGKAKDQAGSTLTLFPNIKVDFEDFQMLA